MGLQVSLKSGNKTTVCILIDTPWRKYIDSLKIGQKLKLEEGDDVWTIESMSKIKDSNVWEIFGAEI